MGKRVFEFNTIVIDIPENISHVKLEGVSISASSFTMKGGTGSTLVDLLGCIINASKIRFEGIHLFFFGGSITSRFCEFVNLVSHDSYGPNHNFDACMLSLYEISHKSDGQALYFRNCHISITIFNAAVSGAYTIFYGCSVLMYTVTLLAGTVTEIIRGSRATIVNAREYSASAALTADSDSALVTITAKPNTD